MNRIVAKVIGYSVALIVILIILFVYIRSQTNHFFVEFEDEIAVYEFINAQYEIGETTQSEIEQQIENKVYGVMRCNPVRVLLDAGESGINCEVLGSNDIIFPKVYLIIFYFDMEILSSIEVHTVVNVP